MSKQGYYFSLMNSQENKSDSELVENEVTLSINSSNLNNVIAKKEEESPTPTLSSIYYYLFRLSQLNKENNSQLVVGLIASILRGTLTGVVGFMIAMLMMAMMVPNFDDTKRMD